MIHVASWDGRGRVGTRGVPGRFFACQDIWRLRMVFTVLRHIVSRDGFWRFGIHCVPGWFLAFWDTSCPGMVFGVLGYIWVAWNGFSRIDIWVAWNGFSRIEIHLGSLEWVFTFQGHPTSRNGFWRLGTGNRRPAWTLTGRDAPRPGLDFGVPARETAARIRGNGRFEAAAR